MFYVGREKETEEFMRLLRKKTSSLVTCKGRRRVGKSTFIRRCAKKVEHFFLFDGLPPRKDLEKEDQLASFSEQLAEQTTLPKVKLDSWPQAFQLLASAVPSSGWTLILLDEISWMSIGDADFAGHLKQAWDRYFSQKPQVILVLCGSVSSWLEENILNSTGFVGRCSWNFQLEPLELPYCNEFWRNKRVSAAEKLTVLAVTGAIPRYLEEINPSQSAEQNIKRLCFNTGGLLFGEFDQIFHDIFNRRAKSYRDVVRTLTDGPRTVSQISKSLRQKRGGVLSDILVDLAQAGFLSRDESFNINTGETQSRSIRYRLSDNYIRFYLKYIEPKKAQIRKGLWRQIPLESFPGWDSIMGLQFENLVYGNFNEIRKKLGLEGIPIVNAGPYWQSKTQRRLACQIDLLIRTKRAVYVIEVKFRKKIERSVISEVQKKIERIKIPSGMSVRTGLIYEGSLAPSITKEDYFDIVIPFGELLGQE